MAVEWAPRAVPFPLPAGDGRPALTLQTGAIGYIYVPSYFRGRTGFDLKFEAQAACRGWFVGLVKNRAKKINADHQDLALAA